MSFAVHSICDIVRYAEQIRMIRESVGHEVEISEL